MDRLDPQVVTCESDFILWLESQIALLRERRFEQLDLDQVLDELEAIVRSHKNELHERLEVIIMHLLKCEYQSRPKSSSWLKTLGVQRAAIERLLESSPSLRNAVPLFAQQEYPRAVRSAVMETGLPKKAFPAELPYTAEQLLDFDFVP